MCNHYVIIFQNKNVIGPELLSDDHMWHKTYLECSSYNSISPSPNTECAFRVYLS